MGMRVADRTGPEREALAAHLRDCKKCAKLTADIQRLEQLLTAAPPDSAPTGFTQAVMARVKALDAPTPASWHHRVIDFIRAPAPTFSFRQAIAVGAVLLMVLSVGMFAGRGHLAGPAPGPSPTVIADAPGGQPASMDAEFVAELLARHQAAGQTQPLSDDEGMRLVSFP